MAVFVETVNGHQLAAAIKELHRLKPEDVLHAIGLVSTLFLAFGIARIVYNIWFHPLSRVPGPLLESAIDFPTAYKILIKGTGPGAMKKWHEQYGPVVRIGPNRLSFDGEIGWPAIFGHRKPGQPEYEKSPSVFGEKRHLLVASKEVHRRQRRQLAHAFSDASLVQQEPTVNKYVDMLMEYLTTQAQSGEALDIVKWFNFTTFDIIGDLAFTESFRSLESRSYNPWVLAIFQGIRGGALLRMFYNYPFGNLIVKLIKLSPKVRTLSEIRSHARNKAIARMEYGAERMEGHKDFTTYMMKTNRDGEPGMDREEILQNAPTIVIAGSETTATSLSGFCFYVRQNPNVYDTLASEIRSAFSSDADISMTSTAALQYLAAVINETLRVYPPVATTPERHSPGGVIDGQYIPADTLVSISQWYTFRNPKHWVEPDSYIPERWLPPSHPLYEERFEYDNHAVFKPFSFGSRDCIGKNLAFAEMRLVIARLLYRFDFKLEPGQEGWHKQRSFALWEKGPLNVKLHLRQTD